MCRRIFSFGAARVCRNTRYFKNECKTDGEMQRAKPQCFRFLLAFFGVAAEAYGYEAFVSVEHNRVRVIGYTHSVIFVFQDNGYKAFAVFGDRSPSPFRRKLCCLKEIPSVKCKNLLKAVRLRLFVLHPPGTKRPFAGAEQFCRK